MDWLVDVITLRIANLELYRWMFIGSVWLPWLLVELWFFLRLRERFARGEEILPAPDDATD